MYAKCWVLSGTLSAFSVPSGGVLLISGTGYGPNGQNLRVVVDGVSHYLKSYNSGIHSIQLAIPIIAGEHSAVVEVPGGYEGQNTISCTWFPS